MGKETKRYRQDVDFGKVLYGIVEMYARIQEISFSSMVRQALSDKFRNELNGMGINEPMKPIKKEWPNDRPTRPTK